MNFSTRGISATVGARGASVNLSSRGTYLNTGIPGTGLSNRTKIGGTGNRGGNRSQPSYSNQPQIPSQPRQQHLPQNQSGYLPREQQPVEEVGAIRSGATEDMTSASLQQIKNTLIEAFGERQVLLGEIHRAGGALQTASAQLQKLQNSWFARTFRKKKIEETEASVAESQAMFDELQQQLQLCSVQIENRYDAEFEKAVNNLLASFRELLQCRIIWDVTSSVGIGKTEKSAAGSAVRRTPVKFEFTNVAIVDSSQPAMRLQNANGGDLFLYPGFLLYIVNDRDLALIDYKDLRATARRTEFLEEEQIPPDTRVVGQTWYKVNKNGSPDMRFRDNYQIPVVEYGKIEFLAGGGLNEAYMFSSFEKAEKFAQALTDYQTFLNRVGN